MSLFTRLVILALAILGGILLWDLSEERLVYPGKKLIVFADMFGPGEPMQRLYGGPAEATVPFQPFTRDHVANYRALIEAWPKWGDRIRQAAQRIHGLDLAESSNDSAANGELNELIEQYKSLDPGYVAALVDALGQSDRSNRLKLFYAFATAHPRFERDMVLTFERLHPGYEVGLFEDFERLHPDYKIVPRWDGRWVLSANRPRFLTGSDVPDIIVGSNTELRILMREDLGLPLDEPLPGASKESWRTRGVLRGEAAYDDPHRTWADEFYPWALERSRYTVSPEDHTVSENPHKPGEQVIYFLPRLAYAFPIFYNKAHFRLIGRDPDDTPKTVEEFEDICRQLIAKGKEPIANDGAVYVDLWWSWLIYRTIGYDRFADTVMNKPGAPRLAGPNADPRYLQIAQRMRKWRDDGFWMKNFSSSMWPGAQRDFGNGRCTFLLSGTWIPTELASTRNPDKAVFDLGCFAFPQVTGGTGDADSIMVGLEGFVLCRQGRNTENAVVLLRYLTARGGSGLAKKLNYISTTRGVPFPPALAGIERAMTTAPASKFLGDGPAWYAPKFSKFVLSETFPDFFLVREKSLSPEQFVETLEQNAQRHYAEHDGTAE